MPVSEDPIRGVQRWLYLTLALVLALCVVIGVIAWTWMILADVDVPSAFTTVLKAIVGSFAGIFSPLRPPGRSGGAPTRDDLRLRRHTVLGPLTSTFQAFKVRPDRGGTA